MLAGLTQLIGTPLRRRVPCNASMRALTVGGTSMQTKVRIPAPPSCWLASVVRRMVASVVDGAVMLHEIGLRAKPLAAFGRDDALIVAVQQQPPSLDIVAQADIQHLFLEVVLQSRVFDGHENFDAAIQVALHPVGAADVDVFGAAVFEIDDAAMLKKASDDADDFDLFREPRHPR